MTQKTDADMTALQQWRKKPKFFRQLLNRYRQKIKKSKSPYLFLPLADIHANLGELDSAVAVLRVGLEKRPNYRAAKIMLAQLLYDRGEVDECRSTLKEVVRKWPDATAAVFLLSKIEARNGDVESAAKMADKLTDHFPDSRFVNGLAKKYSKAWIEKYGVKIKKPTPRQGSETTAAKVEMGLSAGMVSNAVTEEKPVDDKFNGDEKTPLFFSDVGESLSPEEKDLPIRKNLPPGIEYVEVADRSNEEELLSTDNTPPYYDNAFWDVPVKGVEEIIDSIAPPEVPPVEKRNLFSDAETLDEVEKREVKRVRKPKKQSATKKARAKKDESQMALFKLESMLDKITSLKEEK